MKKKVVQVVDAKYDLNTEVLERSKTSEISRLLEERSYGLFEYPHENDFNDFFTYFRISGDIIYEVNDDRRYLLVFLKNNDKEKLRLCSNYFKLCYIYYKKVLINFNKEKISLNFSRDLKKIKFIPYTDIHHYNECLYRYEFIKNKINH